MPLADYLTPRPATLEDLRERLLSFAMRRYGSDQAEFEKFIKHLFSLPLSPRHAVGQEGSLARETVLGLARMILVGEGIEDTSPYEPPEATVFTMTGEAAVSGRESLHLTFRSAVTGIEYLNKSVPDAVTAAHILLTLQEYDCLIEERHGERESHVEGYCDLMRHAPGGGWERWREPGTGDTFEDAVKRLVSEGVVKPIPRYTGKVGPGGHTLGFKADGRPLPARTDLLPGSSSFDWGNDTAGTFLLAVSILADHLEDDGEAVRLHEPIAAFLGNSLSFAQPFSLSVETLEQQVQEAAAGL